MYEAIPIPAEKVLKGAAAAVQVGRDEFFVGQLRKGPEIPELFLLHRYVDGHVEFLQGSGRLMAKFSPNPFSRVKNFEFKIYQLRRDARGNFREEDCGRGRALWRELKRKGGGPTNSGREPAPPRATEQSSNRSPPISDGVGEPTLPSV
jgi:hypothetical protein